MGTDELTPSLPRTPKLQRRSYLPHEVEAGLQALVLCGSSAKKAAKLTGLPPSTLDKWVTLHRDRLDEIRRDRGPELERMAIDGFRAYINRTQDAKLEALDATLEDIRNGRCKDPARALQSISVSEGIAVQRMLELDGRPQGVQPGEASVGELMRKLQEMFGETEPPPDATVVEPAQLPPAES